MKILYIDAVGPFGGASRSLFEAVRVLAEVGVEPYFVTQLGTSQEFYTKVAKDYIATHGLTRFDNTRASHYRGVRWLILLREFFHLPYTIAALFKARQRWKRVDVIHVNEVTDIIPGLIAKWLFGAPMVVHVRSLQQTERSTIRTRWVNARLKNDAAAVIAIDLNTRATLPFDLWVDVIQNSFTPVLAPNPDLSMLAKLEALRPSSLKIGFVGNLHYSKGIFDLLEAAKLIHDAGGDVEYLVVGGTTANDRGLKAWLLARAGLAENIQVKLREKRDNYGLQKVFHLMGATPDIQRVYERLDVVVFPSHYDAPGRPVFEAAFSGVPSIVCVEAPKPDTLVHGSTGLAISAKDPKKLAEAILLFLKDRTEAQRMGVKAKLLAESNFEPRKNALRLLGVYRRVCASKNASTT